MIAHFFILLGYGNGYDDSTRQYRSGRVAGESKAIHPKLLEEMCHLIEEEPPCNADYKFRTIMGECNNLG